MPPQNAYEKKKKKERTLFLNHKNWPKNSKTLPCSAGLNIFAPFCLLKSPNEL